MAKLNLDLSNVPEWVGKKIRTEQGYTPDHSPAEIQQRLRAARGFMNQPVVKPSHALDNLSREERLLLRVIDEIYNGEYGNPWDPAPPGWD
jgi:hypothetical protein